MPVNAERAIRQSIRDKSFERVYYLYGDDDFLKDALVRDVVDSVIPASAREFDAEILRGPEVSAEVLDTALATPPLISERRLVVIRDVHGLRREARRTLSDYLQRPSDGTILLMVQRAGDKASPELRDAAVPVEFEPLSAERVPRWIGHHATKVLGKEIGTDAAALLQRAVGNDLPQLASELEKLASYSTGDTITTADVEAVVGIRADETLGGLLDAVAEQDAVLAARLVDAALAQPKATLVSVVMALTTQTLALACGRAAMDRGLARVGLERFFYSLLRESRVYPGRAWGEAVGCWARATPHWDIRAIEMALSALLVADTAAKDARLTSEEHLLATLVVSLSLHKQPAAV